MKKQKLELSELKAEMKKLKGKGIDETDIREQLEELASKLPDSPDKDYWTTPDMDVAAIKAK